jgi:hypothetical protein
MLIFSPSVGLLGLPWVTLSWIEFLHKPNPLPPMMCTRVSSTEQKLPPRSRVNASAVSAVAACKTLLFAQRSYP